MSDPLPPHGGDPGRERPGNLANQGLLHQDVIAVAVKHGLAELTKFSVEDGDGRQIGEVVWEDSDLLDTLTASRRRRLHLEARLPQTLIVRDAGGVLLRLTRPQVGWDKVLLRVARPDGSEVGVVVGSFLRRGTFKLISGGQHLGTIRRHGASGAPRGGYTITDLGGVQVARIDHAPGLPATPEAHRSITEIRRPLTEPLASLVLASALTVDTALTTYGRLG